VRRLYRPPLPTSVSVCSIFIANGCAECVYLSLVLPRFFNFLLPKPCWQAPEICTLYALDVPPSAVLAVPLQRFEKNRDASDPKLIDILIHKSRQEYQEAVNFWKQEPHVLGPLLTSRDRPHRTFLQKFFEGVLSYAFRSYIPALTQVGSRLRCQGEMRTLFFPHRPPMYNIFCIRIDLFFRHQVMVSMR
jgi:hypothetical protein